MAPPFVADTNGMGIAQRAAEAVGLTVTELADLMVDQGVTALPTSDGITDRYTLGNLGERLWSELREKRPDDRSKWFDRLAEVQQIATIVTLRNMGFSSETIAHDFDVGVSYVSRTFATYSASVGAQVVGIRLDTIAGQLQMASERAQEMAVKAGDHAAYWRIQRELVTCLQSIGIVDQAIHRVEVTHKLGAAQQAELDALVSLELKRENRRVEITVHNADAEAVDAMPVEVSLDEDDDDS